MIEDPEALRRHERKRIRSEPVDFVAHLRIFEALWFEGVALGVLPPADPLEGLDVDLRLRDAFRV